ASFDTHPARREHWGDANIGVEDIMKATVAVSLLAAVMFGLPAASFAQSNERDYCRALVAKYESYLDRHQRRGESPPGVASKPGVEQCKAGDPAGIPAIEDALRNAKLDLPSRS